MNDDPSDRESPPEDELVVRATTQRAAFGLLFDRYYPRVLGYCLRRLPGRAAAEDTTSEVFLSVASHLRGFTGRTETDFRRWLFRIATNAVNASLRQAGRREAILKTAICEGHLGNNVAAHSPVVEHEALDWPTIAAALSELDEREQAIITLRFFAALSHEEIAGVVDSTAGAVRTALSRALARLRTTLDLSSARGPNA